jgi:hypothetical protein
MKHIYMLCMAFLIVFVLHYAIPGSTLVSADHDDEKYEHYHKGDHDEEEDRPYEDIGKTVGWGTVVAMGTSGILFPLRRSLKVVITNFPDAKQMFISISKFFGKYHFIFGILALVLGTLHGITMYLSEGELESEGILGLGAVAFLAIAGIVGSVLMKNKKAKALRTTHSILIVMALLIGFVHIFVS